MEPIPVYSIDLVAELDKQFPERCPGVKDTERDIWLYTGKRELIRNLLLRAEMAREAERKDSNNGQ